MTHIALLILSLIIGLQGIRTLIALRRSFAYIEGAQTLSTREGQRSPRLIVIIPCLHEQNSIGATLVYFNQISKELNDGCLIYTVTTHVEESSPQRIRTWDVIAKEIDHHSYTRVRNIHFPHSTGFMAHQFNFAVRYLEEHNLIRQDDYLVFYNADSRPHANTLIWVLSDIARRGESNVYQQLSIVLKNFDDLGRGLRRVFLKAFAIYQTRFSLTHELPRLRRTVSKSRVLATYANAHCIGHGIFMPLKKFKELEGFSEKTITEDLFLGYLLRATGSPILPIPYCENIDSPSSIWRNLRQKYIWFWGPMYYPYYYFHFVRMTGRHSLRALMLTLQGIFSASAWALSGPIVVAAILLAVWSNDLLISSILAVLLFIYAPLQYYCILTSYPRLIYASTGVRPEARSMMERIAVSAVSFFAIVLSSVPPYVSMTRELLYRLLGVSIVKRKTES